MNKKLVYIKHASSHHAEHSGYAKLLDYVPGDYLPKGKSVLPYRIRKLIASYTSADGGIYNSNSVQKEICLAKDMLANSAGIAHFLNGERDIHYSTYLKGLRNWKFVATFHKPPDLLDEYITDYTYLRRLDGAIAVGQNQVDFLRERLKINEVFYIPHGVDTVFFSPSNQIWEEHTCLFVGHHLRDFEALGLCVEEIKKHFPDFKLRAVLKKDASGMLPKSSSIEVFSDVSDEELRELYRTSACLILPLLDTTACNSILEALACGVPIVTNDVGGVRGYINDDCGYLLKSADYKGMAEVVINLMNDEKLNQEKRLNCRIQSTRFSWDQVASRMLEYYSMYLDY